MTEKIRFTAPEALVMSGKVIWALAMPMAAKAMEKKTCMQAHRQDCGTKPSLAEHVIAIAQPSCSSSYHMRRTTA